MTHENYNPVDLGQWLFYVVKRSTFERLGSASVGLATVVRSAKSDPVWAELRKTVHRAAEGEEIDETLWWS
ncbi:hypothetical protein [Paeniglutamicibacter sp. Y32M11]|uniref:hypothetical protein n=1 Tax=Paeniglutamicibacter sp. Y32M11 TaxID=2853258 RepID=UPI001C52E98C|nr:hypothetical protein [Paeniglutamicibacter sp. Y32M11]QXQ09819.1 hypothetical protein KUF55_15410 [Paeniglutamicibacter sp. Y32M11]